MPRCKAVSTSNECRFRRCGRLSRQARDVDVHRLRIVDLRVMLLVGILLRGSQAGWFALDAGVFYSLLSLHGVGMLTAMTISGLGTLWYLVNRETPLNEGVAYVAFGLFVGGVAAVIVSVVVGHYGALWTMLYPLPFVGTYWPSWATGAWLVGTLLVMVAFTIWCAQILGALVARFGGLRGMLGIDYVSRNRAFVQSGKEPPAPEMFAAAITAIDGFIAAAVGLLLGIALIVHWLDPSVPLDPYWAKNLTYMFGHTFANLTMYMAVAGVYVGLPLCTKRSYHTSVQLTVAWWGTLTFVIIAYFHHMYMDFANPNRYSTSARSLRIWRQFRSWSSRCTAACCSFIARECAGRWVRCSYSPV